MLHNLPPLPHRENEIRTGGGVLGAGGGATGRIDLRLFKNFFIIFYRVPSAPYSVHRTSYSVLRMSLKTQKHRHKKAICR